MHTEHQGVLKAAISFQVTGPILTHIASHIGSRTLTGHIAFSGGITRQNSEGRIPFLARLRNKVLEPLHWQHSHTNNGTDHNGHRRITNSSSSSSYTYLRSNATSSSSSNSRRGSSTNGSSMDSSSSSFGDEVEDGFVFKADKVVFLNDVYFCAQHVHRLLAHEGVNLACGLDYYFTSTASYVPKAWRQGIWGLQVQLMQSL